MKVSIVIEVVGLEGGGYTLCASDDNGAHFVDIRIDERKGPLVGVMRTLKKSLYKKRWHMADGMPIETVLYEVAARCKSLLREENESGKAN